MADIAPQIRITIYNPTMTSVIVADAVSAAGSSIGKGVLQYDDSPDGCGAATIPLAEYYEDVYQQGYWTANNVVEISSGDNTLTTAITGASSGSQKLYVDTNWGFDPTVWYDDQQVFLWDGVTLTMRCPVATIGSDGGGQYVIINQPLGGGGIPAYGINTIVGRRRYCGRIARRTRANDKSKTASITCVGISQDLNNQLGNFAFQLTQSIDISTAIYQVINLFASSYPWLTISSGNFSTLVNQFCSGTYTDSSPATFISNTLKQIETNDGWHVRVGHDRTPRLIKLYTASNNTYAVNITVNQQSPPQAFQVNVADQDLSTFYNQVKVIGDLNPLTKIPVSAIVNDIASQTQTYGSTGTPYVVSTTPIQVTGLKADTDCANYGQAMLDQNSLAKSAQDLVVFTRRNDSAGIALPVTGGGTALKSGDVLPPTANIIATGFIASTIGNVTPPDVTGLAQKVTTYVDSATTDQYQKASFQSMLPPWGAAIQEQANATASQLLNNTLTQPGLDQYFVDQKAFPSSLPFTSISGLTVNTAAYKAIFALNTLPISIPAGSFTLAANTTTWVYLHTNGSYSLSSSPSSTFNTSSTGATAVVTNPSGVIPYAWFQTNATTVSGWGILASIGLIDIPIAYMLNGLPVNLTVTNISLVPGSTGGNVTGQPIIFGLTANATITNQPTDGSLSKIICYYRQQGQPDWLVMGNSPPRDASATPGAVMAGSQTSANGNYVFQKADLSYFVQYEFGIAAESAASTETPIYSLGVFEIGNGQNLIPDSDFTYGNYQGSPLVFGSGGGIGTLETYWEPTPAMDTTAWYLQNTASRKKQVVIGAADAPGEHDFDSCNNTATISVTGGQIYNLSCYIDETQLTAFATTPASTTTAARFDPRYWVVIGPGTAFGAVVTNSSTSLTATAELNAQGDLIGLQWTSLDQWSHPLLKYATNNDYSGITLTFSYTASTNFAALSSTSVPVVFTVTYTDNTVAYIYLKNYYTGSDYSATITMNFDTMHTGVNSSDPQWTAVRSTVIKSLSFGIISTQYVANSTTVLTGGTKTGTVTFSSMSVTLNGGGNAANTTITVGTNPNLGSTALAIGIADDYPDTGILTPQRLIESIQSLGYGTHFDYYVGPSKHYSLHWNSGRSAYEIDSTKNINAATSAWFTDFLTRLHTANIPCTISNAFELLTSQIPNGWDQQDWNSNSAETGYANPTTLIRFMNSTVQTWHKSIYTTLTGLIPSGADVTIQIGEPAWWAGTDNGPTHATIGPCIFDFDTKTAFHTANPTLYAPEIENADAVAGYGSLSSAQKFYVDYCLGQLGTYTDAISSAVKTARGGTKVSVLWYGDAILANCANLGQGDNTNGLMQYLNLPVAHWKHSTANYDIMEVENYGDVTPSFSAQALTNLYQMASGAEGSGYLGYPNSAIRYYFGLATSPDASQNQPANFTPMLQACKYAENLGIGTIILWAYTQVYKMGYMFGSLDIVIMSPDETTEYVTAYQLPGTGNVTQNTWTPSGTGTSQVIARLRSRLTSPAMLPSSGLAWWNDPMLQMGSQYFSYTPGPNPASGNSNSSGSGSQTPGANLIPDSGWLLNSWVTHAGAPDRSDVNPLWTQSSGVDNTNAYWEKSTGQPVAGSNNFQAINGSADYWILSAAISVVPGTVYTLSCYFDMSAFTGGPAVAQITSTDGTTTTYATLNATVGAQARNNLQWTCPGGVTQIAVKLDAKSATRVAGGVNNLVFQIPELEVGAAMSAYTNGPSTNSAGRTILSTVPSLPNQSANVVYAGPTSGGAATPAFRNLVTADLPGGTGTVSSVAIALPASTFSISGSPVTGSGTLTGTFTTQSANTGFLGPTSGAAATPTWRALVTADIPASLNATTFANTCTYTTGGITFNQNPGGKTQATLNDYEVGTWTPTDLSAAGLTFTVNSATYVKIGRLVFVQMWIVWPTTPDTHSAAISLPFPQTSNVYNALSVGYNNSARFCTAAADNGSIALFDNPSSGGGIPNSAFSTFSLMIAGTYQSAS